MEISNLGSIARFYSGVVKAFFQSSYPMLSPASFANVADVSYKTRHASNNLKTSRDLRDAAVIFVTSEYLEEFIDQYSAVLEAKVLLVGNGDRDFEHFELKLPKSVRRVFVQNLSNESSLAKVLPIGIENKHLGKNGNPDLFKGDFANAPKNSKVLVGPFSPTHVERQLLLAATSGSNHELVDLVEGYITPRSYASLASRYSYIASPRGNGLDTHRFWEAFYRGSTPIVMRSSWADAISNLGLPVIKTESWELEQLAASVQVKPAFVAPHQYAPLWMPYWEKRIRAVV